MTTGGEGGMITTNDPILAARAWSYKDHGKNREAIARPQTSNGFRWLHDQFGTNARMLEAQAVIGRIQLRRLAGWSALRRQNAMQIWATAAKLPGLRVPVVPHDIQHGAYKCYVFVEPEALRDGWDRDRILAAIHERGIPCYSGSCSEIYRENAFDGTGLRPRHPLPNAVALGQRALMFLVHPTLREDEIDRTCQVLQEVMELAAHHAFKAGHRRRPSLSTTSDGTVNSPQLALGLRRRITQLRKKKFVGHVAALMTGAVIAQAVPILLSPILTRLYSPEDFAALALFLSVNGVIAVVAAGRYDEAILLPSEEKDAVNVVALSWVVLLGICSLLAILAGLAHGRLPDKWVATLHGDWFYLLPLTVFVAASFQILSIWNNRCGRFPRLALARAAQGTSGGTAQCGRAM